MKFFNKFMIILVNRYGCTVGANVSIFLMTWIFLTKMGAKASCTVSYEDASSFSVRILTIGIKQCFWALLTLFYFVN